MCSNNEIRSVHLRSVGDPGPRIVVLGRLLSEGARLSGSPDLAAAVATAVQRVLLTSICRRSGGGELASGMAPGDLKFRSGSFSGMWFVF